VANELQQKLAVWFAGNARELPWRRSGDPYAIWVSEIMLQQTRVDTVIPYYHRFLAAFPDVQALAHAPEERLMKLWEGLGYYRRARNLQTAARVLATERGGRFPESAEEWRRLPGIGRYTAAAIASIAQGERVAVLDGNVKRVLARLYAIEKPVDDRAVEQKLWRLAESLVPSENPGDHNQAIMELGATICLPRQPRCGECPLREKCKALLEGKAAALPIRIPKRKVPHKVAAAAVIRRSDGAILLEKRASHGLLGGLWELPCCEVAGGMKPEEALEGFLKERFGLDSAVGIPLCTARHAYSHFTIAVQAFEVVIRSESLAMSPMGAGKAMVDSVHPTGSGRDRQTLESAPPLDTPPAASRNISFEHSGRTLAWVELSSDPPFALHRVMQKILGGLKAAKGTLPL